MQQQFLVALFTPVVQGDFIFCVREYFFVNEILKCASSTEFFFPILPRGGVCFDINICFHVWTLFEFCVDLSS